MDKQIVQYSKNKGIRDKTPSIFLFKSWFPALQGKQQTSFFSLDQMFSIGHSVVENLCKFYLWVSQTVHKCSEQMGN